MHLRVDSVFRRSITWLGEVGIITLMAGCIACICVYELVLDAMGVNNGPRAEGPVVSSRMGGLASQGEA